MPMFLVPQVKATDAPPVLESVRSVLPAPGIDRITSTQNSLVKYAARLRTSRQLRGASGTVLISGRSLLQEVLRGDNRGAERERERVCIEFSAFFFPPPSLLKRSSRLSYQKLKNNNNEQQKRGRPRAGAGLRLPSCLSETMMMKQREET